MRFGKSLPLVTNPSTLILIPVSNQSVQQTKKNTVLLRYLILLTILQRLWPNVEYCLTAFTNKGKQVSCKKTTLLVVQIINT